MNLQQSHFELFGLPERFGIDAAALDAAYRQVQAQVHPDRYAGAGAAEQRVALQWATQANGAYQTLRDPVRRAAYLCERRGVAVQGGGGEALPADFLMTQMELREALDDARAARDVDALDRLAAKARSLRADMIGVLAAQLDGQGDAREGAAAAATSVRKLMFLDKLAGEVDAALELIEA